MYEYKILDFGPNAGNPVDSINEMAKEGWRLIAVAQRVGQSEAIRHYFERIVEDKSNGNTSRQVVY